MINRYNWILEIQSNSHENSCRTDVQKQQHQCGELLEPSPITLCSGVDWASLFQQWDKTSRSKTGRSCKYSSHGQGDVGISGNQSTSCLLICLLLNPTPYRISSGRSLQAPMLSFGDTEISAPKNGGETANRPCPFHTFIWGQIW